MEFDDIAGHVEEFQSGIADVYGGLDSNSLDEIHEYEDVLFDQADRLQALRNEMEANGEDFDAFVEEFESYNQSS